MCIPKQQACFHKDTSQRLRLADTQALHFNTFFNAIKPVKVVNHVYNYLVNFILA